MRDDRQRLDKWLWFGRFVKTRSLAAKLVCAGHVRVNGARCDTPAKAVAVGDVLTIALERSTRVVRIEGLGTRRGPAPEAQRLYRDLSAGAAGAQAETPVEKPGSGSSRDDPPLVTGESKG